ncbi:MAG: TetR/AcrR family transcriptional regulator [Acidobacteriota bacterium]
MQKSNEEKLRRRVVEEADAMFFTTGFSAVTMDDLANRLGMSKKTLYRLFKSKQELLRAVMRKIVGEVEAATNAVFEDQSLGFLDKLHSVFSIIGFYVMRLRQPVLDDIRRNAMDVWEEFDAWRQQRVLGKFGGLIRQGISEGFIRDCLDPQLLTIIYSTLIRRVMNPETLAQLPLSSSQTFATLLSVFFEGILTPEGRTRFRAPGDQQNQAGRLIPFLKPTAFRED